MGANAAALANRVSQSSDLFYVYARVWFLFGVKKWEAVERERDHTWLEMDGGCKMMKMKKKAWKIYDVCQPRYYSRP